MPKREFDLASLLGIAVALCGVAGGLVLEGGRLSDLCQATAALIVLGGTAGAMLITTPLPIVLRAMKRLPSVFWHEPLPLREVTRQILALSTKARRSGIVSLEPQVKQIADAFMRKAVTLAVDGADRKVVREIMELELQAAENRADVEARVFECAGGYAPTVGIIGAVLGLIQVMKHLGDMEAVGHGIAVAFVATIYGVALSNLFLLPAASKLRARSNDELHQKELMLEGVLAMAEGLHPFLIESKLEAFEPEGQRKQAGPMSVSAAPARKAAG